MSLVLPTEDASDDVWDTLLNAALTLVDAHDHTDGNGVPVPTAGIEIDADLAFGGFAATGLRAIDFNAVTAITSGYLTSLFVNAADNELYWRTAGGVNVQVTDGSSLNSSLLGGFTGDYGSGDEEANYSAGSSIYNFLADDSPATRAYIDCSDIRLFEATGGVTNAVKLRSPASLAASYTLTMPAALPAGQRLLQLEADGDIVASNPITAATVISSTLNVTGAVDLDSTLNVDGAAELNSTLNADGAATLGSTLGVTGLITATAGLTAATGQHVTVQGTGRFKHGSMVLTVPAAAAHPNNGATHTFDALLARWVLDGTNSLAFPIVLPVGARILDIEFIVVADGSGTKTMQLFAFETSLTTHETTTFTNDFGSGAVRVAIGVTPDVTIAANTVYSATYDSDDANDIVYGMLVTYDFP